LGNTYTGIGEAVNSLGAQEARFNNAAFAFKQALAENGFAEAYTQFIVKLTELLKSEEGQKLAKTLSQAFVGIIDVLKLLVDNIDTVKIVLSALIGLTVFKWIGGIIGGVTSLLKILSPLITVVRTAATGVAAVEGATVAAASGVGIFRVALLSLARAIPYLGALTIAIEAAMFAYDKLFASKKKVAEVELKVDKALPEDLQKTLAEINKTIESSKTVGLPGAAGTSPTADPGTGGDAGTRAADALAKTLEKNQAKLDKAMKQGNKRSAKDDLDERKSLIDQEYKLLRDSATSQITDKTKLNAALLTIDKQHKQALLIDQQAYNNDQSKKEESAGNKRIQLQEQIKNELLKIQDSLVKQETKADATSSFEERKKARLDDIAHSYDKLKKTIKSLEPLDKKGAADASKKLDIYISQLQTVEGIRATQDEVKRLEKELTDQQALRADLLDQEKTKYDAGLISQQEFLKNTAEINNRSGSAITKAASDLQGFVDAAVAAKDGILSVTDQSAIKTKTTTATASAGNADNKNFEQAAQLQEAAINGLIEKRSQAEAVFKAQLDTRLIGEDTYAKKINETSELYKANIAAQIAALVTQMEAQKAQALLNSTMNEADLLALDAKILKYQALGIAIQNAAAQQDLMAQYTQRFITQGLDAALDSAATSLAAMASGQMSVADGFEAMLQSAGQFFSQFLLDIAKAIIKQLLLNALANSSVFGAGVSAAAGAAGGVKNHRGGIVGAANGTNVKVNPAWFANAPRFHEGGVAGLRSDEVPTILQTNEEVLARDDPRNVLNGGRPGMGGGGANRFVLVDDRSKVAEAMASAEGERVTMLHLKRNVASLKQWTRG
jgi:hypothetical protein